MGDNMNFKEVLELHIKSIKEKAIDTFITTISEDEVTLIMPNGTLITGRDEVIEFHKDWFSDTDWDMNCEVLKVAESSEVSHALLKVHYTDVDQNGNPYSMNYYLTLIFKKSHGIWGLTFDQNTIIK